MMALEICIISHAKVIQSYSKDFKVGTRRQIQHCSVCEPQDGTGIDTATGHSFSRVRGKFSGLLLLVRLMYPQLL
jgi:hypothetical protein